jgi:hypothetical protein
MKTAEFIVSIVSLIIEVGLLCVAQKALQQISVSKEDIELREKRAGVNLALKEIELYAEEILDLESLLKDCLTAGKIKLNPRKLVKFQIEEITNGPVDLQDEFKSLYTKLIKNPVTLDEDRNSKKLIWKIARKIEAFSIPFVKYLADESVAIEPLGRFICGFVEKYYFFYCAARDDKGVNYYKFTIELYHRWSSKIEITDLEYKRDKTDIQLQTLLRNK